MRERLALAAALLLASIGVSNAQQTSSAADAVVLFEENDLQMANAITNARASLPNFHGAVNAGAGESYLFKAGIPYSGGNEHVWLTFTGMNGEKYTGILGNRPQWLDYKQGDALEVDPGYVSDWAYFNQSGKLVGGFTIRVMLPQLSPDDRAYYISTLSENPKGESFE